MCAAGKWPQFVQLVLTLVVVAALLQVSLVAAAGNGLPQGVQENALINVGQNIFLYMNFGRTALFFRNGRRYEQLTMLRGPDIFRVESTNTAYMLENRAVRVLTQQELQQLLGNAANNNNNNANANNNDANNAEQGAGAYNSRTAFFSRFGLRKLSNNTNKALMALALALILIREARC